MAKLKLHFNNDVTEEICPNCDKAFSARLMPSVCEHCGFISVGCSICPRPSGMSCYGKNCVATNNRVDLYAVFDKKVFDQLPEDYKYYVGNPKDDNIVLMIGNRLMPIFSDHFVYGFTTLDPKDYLKEKSTKGAKKIAYLFEFDDDGECSNWEKP